MLSFLAARENGCDPPKSLVTAETTRRAYLLELSTFYDVEKIHKGGINTLNLDLVEGRYLLSGASDGGIVCYDLHNMTGEPKMTLPSVFSIPRNDRNGHKFSLETLQWYALDTGMFVSSGMDKHLKVWDTNNLVPADEFQTKGPIYCHSMSTIATQHSLIAVASTSSKVRLIDLKSGSSTHTLKGHSHSVLNCKWSTKDEFLLATGSQDSRVFLWDVRSSKGSLMVLDQHNGDTTASPNSVNTAHNGHVNGLCFTSDGLHLLTYGTDDSIRLWSTATGHNTLVNYGKISNESRKAVNLAVSENTKPDLVFVPDDSNINVYDMWTGEVLRVLRGHYNQVNCVLADWNYQTLYTGGNDRNLLVWVPNTEAVSGYEQSLREEKVEKNVTRFLTRVGGTQDAWSSDSEDDS